MSAYEASINVFILRETQIIKLTFIDDFINCYGYTKIDTKNKNLYYEHKRKGLHSSHINSLHGQTTALKKVEIEIL